MKKGTIFIISSSACILMPGKGAVYQRGGALVLSNRKILSVDDSAVIRKIIKSSVEMLNYDLLEASDGKEAMAVISKEWESIVLILLDWNMPGMNGLDFLGVIKKDILYKNIPVMMVTTESEKENIVKAVQAGASNYLLKPFTTEELIKKIIQCVGRN